MAENLLDRYEKWVKTHSCKKAKIEKGESLQMMKAFNWKLATIKEETGKQIDKWCQLADVLREKRKEVLTTELNSPRFWELVTKLDRMEKLQDNNTRILAEHFEKMLFFSRTLFNHYLEAKRHDQPKELRRAFDECIKGLREFIYKVERTYEECVLTAPNNKS